MDSITSVILWLCALIPTVTFVGFVVGFTVEYLALERMKRGHTTKQHRKES